MKESNLRLWGVLSKLNKTLKKKFQLNIKLLAQLDNFVSTLAWGTLHDAHTICIVLSQIKICCFTFTEMTITFHNYSQVFCCYSLIATILYCLICSARSAMLPRWQPLWVRSVQFHTQFFYQVCTTFSCTVPKNSKCEHKFETQQQISSRSTVWFCRQLSLTNPKKAKRRNLSDDTVFWIILHRARPLIHKHRSSVSQARGQRLRLYNSILLPLVHTRQT